MSHLSDEEIQVYLDGNEGVDRASVAAHLRECSACEKALSNYQCLYSALEDASSFEAETRLATQALSRVGMCLSREPTREFVDSLAGAAGIVLAIAVAAWAYLGLGGFEAGVGITVGGVKAYVASSLRSLEFIISHAIPSSYIIGLAVMSGLAAYVILGLDYLLIGRPASAHTGL